MTDTDDSVQDMSEFVPPVVTRTLLQDITKILNRHSIESASNTPDFILAAFLLRVLAAGEELVNERHKWWGLPDPWEKMLSDVIGDTAGPGPEEPDVAAQVRKRVREMTSVIQNRETHRVMIPPEDVDAGEYLAMLGVDAQVWAVEFLRMRGEVPDPDDEGWLISWFANAIMAGYDQGRREGRAEAGPADVRPGQSTGP